MPGDLGAHPAVRMHIYSVPGRAHAHIPGRARMTFKAARRAGGAGRTSTRAFSTLVAAIFSCSTCRRHRRANSSRLATLRVNPRVQNIRGARP